ncbi:hypothetical protein GH714_033763 [Hevea brasiliensis]|uniref:Conserved oligomeric Golgi complex subunit 5 helical domain-containing protein n=1 Tax=Hevea brasiliensis TaxID=3981 RepID=A0A6A6LPN8_HEVBR|nr:hypothetical protein GH714_033763 [Hevea brasiliensis]
MGGLNQAEVGTGLQVFYNLGELKVTVEQLVNKYKGIGVKSVSVALDMKAISAGGGGGGYGPGGRVLSKKRDPFTHVLLLDEVIKEGDSMLTDRVWEALVKAFASQMKSAFTASSFVKEIFTVGYPKLFSMIDNLLERISQDTDIKGVLPAISLEGKEQMVQAIEIFQTAFLALCLSRLSDIVNTVFPVSSRGSIPSKEQISWIISRIQEEIEGVQLDGRLTLLVLHEIGKALLLLAERAEYQKCYLPHWVQYGVARDSVTPLFKAMVDRLESCILHIHEQNFGVLGMDAAMDNNTSPYMEELQKSILHFRTEFLSRLLPSSTNAAAAGAETICTQLVRSMASRVLTFFIRHASLVRPLSESGKLRMARDMAELELAVGQNLYPVEQLGLPYRALRAFRPLIFLETSQLEASPVLQDLPPSVILHHLYSRGPDELQSPLQRNKLTPLQYSLWLDSQGEDQIWKGIKTTLDDYAVKVRSRGDKEFSPVYPLMLQLGSSLTGHSPVSQKP